MNEPTSTAVERRQAPRRRILCPAEVVAAAGGAARGKTIDLSSNGALLALARDLPLGEQVRLRIALPDTGPPLEIEAIVVRSQPPTGNGAVRRVAFHFITISPADQRRLSSLLYPDPRDAD